MARRVGLSESPAAFQMEALHLALNDIESDPALIQSLENEE
jgi:hypothetical protein